MKLGCASASVGVRPKAIRNGLPSEMITGTTKAALSCCTTGPCAPSR